MSGNASVPSGVDGAVSPVPAGSGRAADSAPSGRPAAPAWTVTTLAVSGAVLASAGVVWLVFFLLLRLPLLTTTLILALLLTALMSPMSGRLRRAGFPPWLSALLGVLTLLAVIGGIGMLVGFRATANLQDLTRPLGAAIDRIRVWLIDGPLALDAGQVADMRNQVVSWLYELTPSPVEGATSALYVLSAVVLVLFIVFFLLKDGESMWAWALERVPSRRRAQVDGAGRSAWTTLRSYTGGVVVVALIDAVGIGAALLLLGVPLWPSLTLLTFLGAFVPLFGATVSGAVAVLVTMVTNGFTDAVIVLVVVLAVQQVEGNLLQPLIMSRAVRLHPVVVLVAITLGTLLFGVVGALFATPVVAVVHRVIEYLRSGRRPDEPAADGGPAASAEAGQTAPPPPAGTATGRPGKAD